MPELTRRSALALAAAAAAVPALARAQETPQVVWDLTDLYPTPAAWEAEKAAITAALPGLAAHKGKLGAGAGELRAALRAISDLNKRLNRLAVYAGLKADEDLQVAENQERRQQANALFSQLGEATAWLEPELLNVGRDKVLGFVAADAGLAPFRFQLSDLFRRAPHILTPEGERIVAASNDPLSQVQQVRSQLVLSDIPWPEIELAEGRIRLDNQGYIRARQSPIREERKKVFDAFWGTYKVYERTLGANLATQVRSDIFQAKARNYGSSLEAALSPPGIPTAVYRTLVAEANRGLPVLHRYFDIRRRLLKLPDLHYYDIYPATTQLARKFTLEESRRLTLEAVRPLGPEYVAELTRASGARWTHAYPAKGKVSGAYVNGAAYDVHPYVLLNHTDDYEGMTTFAHEWGHGMHTLLSNKAQPYETAYYPTFTAEVASTVNEALLSDHMLKQARTNAEKLYYLDKLCETFRGTFYRQTMFAEFELAIHEEAEKGEALTGPRLTAIYLDLLKKYHGPGMTIDAAYATEWAYIQHFYFNFYVFQYATSVAAATYFAEQIRTGGAKARDNYLGVLKAGGSDYGVEVLKRAGADMTTPAPYQALIARFAKTLDQMEALMA